MPALASPRQAGVAVGPPGSRCGHNDPARGVGAERCPPGTVRTAGHRARRCRAEVWPRSRRGNVLGFGAVIPGTRGKPARDAVGEKRWRLQPGQHTTPELPCFRQGPDPPQASPFVGLQ